MPKLGQIRKLRDALIALPATFDQQSLESASEEMIIGLIGCERDQARKTLNDMSGRNIIKPEFRLPGGERQADPGRDVHVRWSPGDTQI